MITYEEALARLRENADPAYRAFHKKLLKNEEIEVIGVRTPILRKLAKLYRKDVEDLLSFPDEFYEVTFLKCAVVGSLPYEAFVAYVDRVTPLLDNWAVCDGFDAPCIKSHREEFLPYIAKYFADGREFVKRYALVTLLHHYVEERYLPLIAEYLRACKDERYYVAMAAAWLFAEVIVKYPEEGIALLKEGLDPAVQNKAIGKARDSFRLTAEQKDRLKRFKK